MTDELKVRNCRPQDAGDAAAYESLRESAVFAHLLNKPDYQVERNLFFAGMDGQVIGFINVLPELGINRAILDYAVSPLNNLPAVLPALMKPALKRAKQLGAGVAHLGIRSIEIEPVATLENLGFEPVRRFCDMRLNISDIDLEVTARLDWGHR